MPVGCRRCRHNAAAAATWLPRHTLQGHYVTASRHVCHSAPRALAGQLLATCRHNIAAGHCGPWLLGWLPRQPSHTAAAATLAGATPLRCQRQRVAANAPHWLPPPHSYMASTAQRRHCHYHVIGYWQYTQPLGNNWLAATSHYRHTTRLLLPLVNVAGYYWLVTYGRTPTSIIIK